MKKFKYKRILVIGCSGSGKSTFSRKLSDILSIKCTHLDNLFWKSGWIEEDRNVFIDKIKKSLSENSWIIDGHYNTTLPMRLENCDLVIWFKINRIYSMTGYLKRMIKHFGKTRPDITDGCDEKLDFEFMKYIWNFDKTQNQPTIEILKDSPNVRIITFNSRKQADNFLKKIENTHNK